MTKLEAVLVQINLFDATRCVLSLWDNKDTERIFEMFPQTENTCRIVPYSSRSYKTGYINMDFSVLESMMKVVVGFIILAIAFACVAGLLIGNHGFHF